MSKRTVDKWTKSEDDLGNPISGACHSSDQGSGRLNRRGCQSFGKEVLLNRLGRLVRWWRREKRMRGQRNMIVLEVFWSRRQ